MRLSKKSARILASALALSLSLTMAGCGGDTGSSSGGNVPSPAPSGSIENPTPENPADSSGSGEKKDDSSSENPSLSLYEPVNPAKMVKSFSDDFEFYIIIEYSESGSGRYAKFRGPYSHFTKGSAINVRLNPVVIDSIPEDYLRGERNIFFNYVWDCYNDEIVHVKNSKGNYPVDQSKWEYRDGYKYICEIGAGNKISKISESSNNQELKNFDGWCKDEDVDNFIGQFNLWPQKFVVLNGCPFVKNLKPKEDTEVTGYFLYNNKVYFMN